MYYSIIIHKSRDDFSVRLPFNLCGSVTGSADNVQSRHAAEHRGGGGAGSVGRPVLHLP